MERHARGVSAAITRAWRRRLGRALRPEEAREIAQEAFARVSSRGGAPLARFRFESTLGGYLAAIAVSCAFDRLRSEAARDTREGPLPGLDEI